MAPHCSRMFKYCFVLLLLVLLHESESKAKGGRRTGGGGTKYGSGGNSRHGQHYDTPHHQTNTYNQGNSHPVVPSAPNPPSTNNRNIGFENYNVHGSVAGGHRDIGFENVQHRVPQQNSHLTARPPGSNVNQHNNHGGFRNSSGGGGYHGVNQQHGARNSSFGNHGGYHANSSHVPLNGAHPPQGNYYPNSGGYYNQPHYTHIAPNPPGGYNNPNLAQPGGYYHSYQPVHNGPPPQIYQPYPVKQSSGGSALGYVGSLAGGLAGGYLIGRLTSGGGGGGGHSSNNQNYEVHHYYHNSNTVPKQFAVTNSTLATCSPNATQGLCVPNTFPICLLNGTIMCVTHTLYTTPCSGLNSSSACIISVLPCVTGDPNCNSTNNSTNAVYVPCISNVTLDNPGNLGVVGTTATTNNRVELCVTAIAEPKFPPPPPVGNPPPPPVGNPPQVLYGQPSNTNQLTKSAGSRSFTSGWVCGVILMLWVGIK